MQWKNNVTNGRRMGKLENDERLVLRTNQQSLHFISYQDRFNGINRRT